MNLKKLQHLEEAARVAAQLVLEELKLLWPEGAKLKARLQTNHRKPSECTVLFHPAASRGYIRVRVLGGHETTVHFTQVVP